MHVRHRIFFWRIPSCARWVYIGSLLTNDSQQPVSMYYPLMPQLLSFKNSITDVNYSIVSLYVPVRYIEVFYIAQLLFCTKI